MGTWTLHDPQHTRRWFLGRVVSAAALPLALSACSRDDGSTKLAAALPDDVNLDEVGDAATFRPPFPVHEPFIRVRVLKARPPAKAIVIGKADQWIDLARMDGGSSAAMMGPLNALRRNGGWSITDTKGFLASIDPTDNITVSLADAGAGEWIELREGLDAVPRSYPGTLRLVSRHDVQADAFDVVNDVRLELYLPGVLAGELYRTWNTQTFAAQAVAARSFACTEAAVFAGRRHYDVTNTAASQMYLGAVNHETALQAVAETRGQVLGYDGLLVSGYYSSCCGGLAASAIDAIGSNPVNNVAPLLGRKGSDVCTSAPVFQWAAEQPLEAFSRRLVAFGKDRGMRDLAEFTRLVSIDVIGVNANGRPTRMAVADQAKSRVELSAENFRRAANFTGQGLPPPQKLLKSSNLSAIVGDRNVAFEGFGLGHGVGLCQYGAEALANDGESFDTILRWYYPGVEIVSAYG